MTKCNDYSFMNVPLNDKNFISSIHKPIADKEALAVVHIKMQDTKSEMFSPSMGFENGTIYKDLYKPYSCTCSATYLDKLSEERCCIHG